MSLSSRNGQPVGTKFSLSISGYGALSTSAIADYVPDFSLFTAHPTQISAWSVDADGSTGSHLYTVRNITFTAIDPSELSAVPVPAAVWLFASGLMGLIGFASQTSPNQMIS